MRIWGFKELQGIRLDKTTTAVGMTRNLTQYADIPLWFDEYRRNIPDVELKEAVLRGAYQSRKLSLCRATQGRPRLERHNSRNLGKTYKCTLCAG